MIESTLKVNELADMEWKFGVTAANDELEQVYMLPLFSLKNRLVKFFYN